MTTRSFAPWANRRPKNSPGPNQPLAIRRGDDYTTITTRQAGHDDWDTICDHWETISQIADTEINLPGIASSVGPERGGTSSTTDILEGRNAYLARVAATAWLRELGQLRADLIRLAQRAHIVDPPPTKAKQDQAERCAKCGQEIDPKAPDGKVNRVDGHALHTKTCYLQVWRYARDQGLTIGYVAKQLADGIKLPGMKT